MIAGLIVEPSEARTIAGAVMQVLAAELANQRKLANEAAPGDLTVDRGYYDIRVFEERSTPWELWAGSSHETILNARVAGMEETSCRRPQDHMRLDLDIEAWAVGECRSDAAGGQNAPDRDAALRSQFAAGLARAVLRSGANMDLGRVERTRSVPRVSMVESGPVDNGVDGSTVRAVHLTKMKVGIDYQQPTVFEATPNNLEKIDWGLFVVTSTGEYLAMTGEQTK